MSVPRLQRLRSRISAATHKAYVRSFSGVAPYYVVNEYPKSGGTWLAQMLSDALEISSAFIRFVSQSPSSPSSIWPQFVRAWAHRPGTVQTSYEALRADTPGELLRVAEVLNGEPLTEGRAADVAERHSFARAKQAAEEARSADAEISFVREGALGGWRRHFTPGAAAAFRESGHEGALALRHREIRGEHHANPY